MKKSSLGRRKSTISSRKTSDLIDRSAKSSCIPVSMRPTMGNQLPMGRKRDLSADRASDYGNIATPSTSGTFRTPRQLTMSTGRMSSMGNNKKADNRPLNDKEWQMGAIDAVQMTLMADQEGCDILQNYKSLKPMSLVLFVTVVNHFLSKLDQKLEVNKINYTTELVFILKKLCYKGKVDKMLLQTVNTMHNWPNVLGILQFLAELVQAMEDFKRLGLNPLYPDSLDQETGEDEELNFKHVVPLLHDLWDQHCKKGDVDIKDLVDNNMEKVIHTFASCGYNQDDFQREENLQKELEEAVKREQEAQEKFNQSQQQFSIVKEKLEASRKKSETYRMEVDALKAKLQAEISAINELNNDIRYLEEDKLMKESVLQKYESDSKNNPTPEEYNNYKKKKESLKDHIAFDRDIIFQSEEIMVELNFKTKELKSTCDTLFKDYNTAIIEVMKEDVSVREAFCHSRPRLGVTPCNEGTKHLLEKTLSIYEERIVQLETELGKQSNMSMEFELSEEIKTKSAILNKLQKIHINMIAQHQEEYAGAQKKLDETMNKIKSNENEIASTRETLKQKNEEHHAKEKEMKLATERMIKFHAICQRKLELRYQSIVELNRKMKGLVDRIRTQVKNVVVKLDE